MRIENEKVVFEATERAAEITSFILKENGWEAMWQGNPEFWAGRNPILFPIVGSTFDKIIHLDGGEYKMGNHGLLRAAMFTLESSTDNSMTFSYSSNEETKKQYPFDFKVSVTYTLEGAGVVVHYDIENTGKGLMPFSFGLHPAFNCPYYPEKTYDDYKIVFPCEENQDYTVPMKAEKEIPLSREIFQKYPTLIFEYLNSPYVDLTDGQHGVRVSCAGYRWCAFWTPKNAPFLCIEPWHGHGDYGVVDTDFRKREGTMELPEGKVYSTEYKIELY